MAVVTPTITTDDPHKYREQMELIANYAEGVHLDFADGVLAPTQLLPLESAWRHDDLITHAHIMYQKPLEHIDDIIHLEADLVILHAEADDVKQALTELTDNGTRCGVALLPETSVSDLAELEVDGLFEHVLIFGGHLGYQGGKADLTQLSKLKQLQIHYPDIETSWDGGVSEENITQIAAAGIAVINVGGYLHQAENAQKAYDRLTSLLS